MNIALLAMSGVRAHDPDLVALGITLPGFIRRGQVIASLPSLGLLCLAAVTPPRHTVRYFEAPSRHDVPLAIHDADLVAISTFSAQSFEAYAIADSLRSRNIKVAIGGLHATARPDEALQHADYVIAGEGENVWPAVCAAAEAHASPRIFRAADHGPVDITRLPIPRYDLLDPTRYNRFTVQTTRGCPWRCDFCASTVMLQRPYRKRPIEHVVRDIRAIQSIHPRPFIEFADDNTFVDKDWSRALCRALDPLGIRWFTETDVSVADDEELLSLLRTAGCRQLLIGLESPTPAGLDGIESRSNFKLRTQDRHAASVHAIQRHGVTVNGCFVLGLDGQTPAVFQQILDFADQTNLYDAQATVMTPFPGTPLHDRLLAANRIPQANRSDLCTLFDINIEPTHMSRAELRAGLHWLTAQLHSPENQRPRRRRFLRSRLTSTPPIETLRPAPARA